MASSKGLPVKGDSIYLDVNTNYGINTDAELVADIQALNNSLYNLLTCPIGTRVHKRDYGSNIPWFLQEPCDAITANKIKQSLLQSIRRWEPRVQLDFRNTVVNPLSDGTGFAVEFSYLVVNVNVTGTLKFTLSRL